MRAIPIRYIWMFVASAALGNVFRSHGAICDGMPCGYYSTFDLVYVALIFSGLSFIVGWRT